MNGNLEYITALNVPTGKLGNQLNARLTSLTGVQNLAGTDRVTLGLTIGGTVKNPQVKLNSGSVKAQAKDLVQNIVQAKVSDAKSQLQARAQVAQDSLQRDIARRQQDLQEKARLEIEKKRLEAETRIRSQAKDKLNGILFGKPKTRPAEATEPASSTPAPASAPADTADTGNK